MIEVDNVTKRFGGISAIDGASFTIAEGKITGLIGPNGAGKTTMFNTIAGLHRADAGRVLLEGESIEGLPPHALFKRGVLRTFQLSHEFSTLTVLENLMMVPPDQLGEKILNTWLRRKQIREQEEKIRAKAEEVIEFLCLEHLAHSPAGSLSGGQKKLVELGRTMMVDARVVLLDEVGAGVNKTLLLEIEHAIRRLNSELGYTFCMIEHDIGLISRLCDPIVVMVNGCVLTEGAPGQVLNDPRVIDSYLGESGLEAGS
ncbi:ABC transporter ATP-binding protein [Pseudooceanicola atlanticus]|uniref:ABC transporter ATP-binding protein n=1 Tax=Pseudooceanicola atlanticus TaxID=1461694 RepID=UPI0023561953|nr:ABC transporter ATP-binding protein [Pseudooceanicola atlanticus]